MSLSTAVNIAQSVGDWITAPEPFPKFPSTVSVRQNRRNTIALPSLITNMSDRGGYGYPQPPRSPVMRSAHPARSSAGSLSSRDPYYDYSYSNPRSSGDRLPVAPRSDPRQFDRPLLYRTTRDDYDVVPRRLAVEPRYETRQRAGSAVPQDRRPLTIVPPAASERDRVRPQISSAGLDRPRTTNRSDDYYVVPASSTRSGHGRHLSADVDDRGRYSNASTYGRPPPQYVDPSRDAGRYYEPGRRPDEGLARRAYDSSSRGGHLYPETTGRARAGSDVGARERPNLSGQEYVRERPRGPPPSTRGFDKLDRGVTKQIYRLPREDTMSSTSSRDSAYRNNTSLVPHEKRQFHDRPITLHQDFEYGYSSAEERGGPGRDKLPSRHRHRDESRDRNGDRERRFDDRYGSDSERQRHKHHRDRSARPDREKHHRDESVDRHGAGHRPRRDGSEDRYAATRIEDDSHRHKSKREDTGDDEERRRRRHEEKDRDRDRDRDREKDRDRTRDKDKDKDRGDDRNRKIAETLGLGGAGAALVGLARDAIKKRTDKYNGGEDDEERDRGRSDRYGDDGLSKHRKDETDDERKERHRLRRETETEEERQERKRKRRERRERRDREEKEKDNDKNGDGGERVRDKLQAGGVGAAAGAALGAVTGDHEKTRDRSRARFEGDDKDKDKDDQHRRRRRRKQHTSESDTSSSSESDIDRDRAPRMRSRANSAARPPPTKGILKNPTPKFPENKEAIREGVAPLKDAKGQKGIPPNARWTKIDRRLVNPAALAEAQERFEERADHVIVLRVLTREDIEKYARRTQEIREERNKQGSEADASEQANYDRMVALEAEQQRRMDQEARDNPPLAIEDKPHSVDPTLDKVVQQAAANNHSSRTSPYSSRNNSPPQAAGQHGSGTGTSPVPVHPAYAPPPQQQTWEALNHSSQSLPAYGRDVVQSPDSLGPENGYGRNGNGSGSLSAAMHDGDNRSRSASGGKPALERPNGSGFGNGAPTMAGAQPNGNGHDGSR